MKNIPLLILHGALGSKDQFTEIAAKLSDNFEVHLLNFSGHGGRNVEGEFSIDRFTNEVLKYLDVQNLEQVNIFGYSMGGYVALNLARQYQKRVNRIITLGTKFHWTPESAAHEVKFLDPVKIEEKIPVFAATLQKRHAPEDWKKVLGSTAEMMIRLGNGDAMKPEDLKNIPHQVIIGIGGMDNMVSIEESKTFSDAIPNGKLMIFEGFKHPVEQIDIDFFIEVLKNNMNASLDHIK